MPSTPFPNDPLWPRAAHWITPVPEAGRCRADLGILGVPAHLTSITPTGAHATPDAIREALARFSTYATSRGVDVADLVAIDFGDVSDPDGPEGEERVGAAAAAATDSCELLVVLGGDNSATYSAMRGVAGEALSEWGLVTVDAHHDLRDGETNGSPVRRLIEAGLRGAAVAQIGIGDFSNSAAYAARARELGISVVPRSEMRRAEPEVVAGKALLAAGEGGRPVYVDLDVDVCDRAVVPGCPSAAPGGISADELRELTFLLARDPRVRAIDITEIDATIDAADGRTVRLAALLVLEIAAGLLARRQV